MVRWWLIATLALASVAAPAAQDRYDYDGAGRLIRHIDTAGQGVEYGYDPAGNIRTVSPSTADALAPVLQAINPATLRRGAAARLTLTGERLQAGTLSASHPGLAITGIERAATRLGFDLAVDPGVPLGAHAFSYASAAGSAQIAFTVAPALPTVGIEPSPLALPPDGAARQVVLRLSHADGLAHKLSLSSSDVSKGSISPSSLTLSAGQTTALVSVTPKAAGFFTLTIGSDTLAPVSVPVFITTDFRGVNTSHARAVGVRVGEVAPAAPRSAPGHFGASGVGVAVGSVLTQVAPRGAAAGSTLGLTIRGHGLPDGAQLAIVPATGASLVLGTAARDRIDATLQLQPDAPAGWRRIEVRGASGQLVPQASADTGLIQVTTGQPELLSVAPLFSERGRVATLTLRGRHLQNAQVRLSPATDLRVDAAPVVSADGTQLSVRVEIAPLASTGARTVQVLTPSGQSPAEPSAANQFTLVSEVRETVTPIASALVGVRVGSDGATPPAPFAGLVLARAGVLVGAGVQSLTPRVGVVGTDVVLELKGQGLQATQSVGLLPAEGLTLGTPTISADGTRLQLPVQIADDAPRTVRRVVLATTSGAVPFTVPGSDQFSLVAREPELMSIAPQVWPAGQAVAVTVRGRNLAGVQSIALQPAAGVAVAPTFTASTDGSTLSFTAQVAADAASGPRTVLVTTPAGASSAEARPANTVRIAQQTGGSLTPIASPLVGVRVGQPPLPTQASAPYLLSTSLVGVIRNTVPQPTVRTEIPQARAVGVIVGPAARRLSPASPDGLLKGASASVVVHGIGLGAVAQVRTTAAGVSAGVPVANADGTQLLVPLSAAADTPSGAVGLHLLTSAGAAPLPVADGSALSLHVGALPVAVHSVSPIVLEQGKTLTLSVRGEGLRDVFAIELDPAAGVRVGPGGARVQWSSDGFGEKLSVPLAVDADAPLGSRVVRLRVPGALSTGEALPANTLTVVAPQ